MSRLIKDGQVSADDWTLVRDVEAGLPAGDVIVPLAFWLQQRDALALHTGRVGVWLAPDDELENLAGSVAKLLLIAVDFPQFVDGRGYSMARLLRERHGFSGELRAIGDVTRDQLYYLEQVGFNAFLLRDGERADEALAGLRAFSGGYQATWRRLPRFA